MVYDDRKIVIWDVCIVIWKKTWFMLVARWSFADEITIV